MKKIVLVLSLLLAGLSAAAPAFSYSSMQNGAAVSLTIVPVINCAGSQCSNEWNECFNPEPDSRGIVNIDTMAAVSCERAKDA